MSTPSPSLAQRLRELLLPGDAPVTTLAMLFCLGGWVLLAVQTGDTGSFSSSALIRAGANFTPFTLHGEPWRLLAYAFLHGGLIHLAMNLYAFHVVGGMVEKRFGSTRYVFIVVATAALAGLASAIATPYAPSVGASGAVLGIIGAGAIAGHLMRNRIGEHTRNQLGIWFLIIMGIGLAGDTFGLRFDNWAHAGGFVSGVAIGAALFHLERIRRRATLVERVLAPALAVLALASAATPWILHRDVPVVNEDTGPRADAVRARAWNVCREALGAQELREAVRPCRDYRLVDWHMGQGWWVVAHLHTALEQPGAERSAWGALRRVNPSARSVQPPEPERARQQLLDFRRRN